MAPLPTLASATPLARNQPAPALYSNTHAAPQPLSNGSRRLRLGLVHGPKFSPKLRTPSCPRLLADTHRSKPKSKRHPPRLEGQRASGSAATAGAAAHQSVCASLIGRLLAFGLSRANMLAGRDRREQALGPPGAMNRARLASQRAAARTHMRSQILGWPCSGDSWQLIFGGRKLKEYTRVY